MRCVWVVQILPGNLDRRGVYVEAMPRSIRLSTLLTALVILGVSACSSDDASPPETTEAFVSPIPTVPNAERQPLIDALDAIAPGLATEPDDTITLSLNTCDSILGGSQTLTESTKTRFIGDGVDTMTDDQAQQIIDLITTEAWCTK